MARSTAEKIGGEFGDVRATIDVEKLNAYLEAHTLEIAAPVTVKQFKVCVKAQSRLWLLAYDCIGLSSDRYGRTFRSLANS